MSTLFRVDVSDSIADPVYTLATLFIAGSPTPTCGDSADSNDDGSLDISDPVFSLSSLFQAGSPLPAPPHPGCKFGPRHHLMRDVRGLSLERGDR